jgi:hypothetical protein
MIKSKRIIWAENIARMARRGMHIEFLWKKIEGKRPLGRTKRTRMWEDNIKMDLRQRG